MVFLFYALFCSVIYLLVEDRAYVGLLVKNIWRHFFVCALIALLLLVCSIPFFSTYLPTAAETGMHPYSEALGHTPSLIDVVNVGEGNILYGRLFQYISRGIRPDFPAFSERTTGFDPVLLVLFGAGTVSLWLDRGRAAGTRDMVFLALALTVVVTWMLIIHVRSASLWWFVYSYFPGAQATRTVARYQIFLAAPIIVVATLYLAARSPHTPKVILGLIVALLILGALNVGAPRNIDRHGELAWLRSVPAPPPECRAFFVSQGRAGGTGMDQGLTDNVAAMIIAETIHLPTLNGLASFVPPGWSLSNPGSDDYLEAVRHFAKQHHLDRLCSLDLRHMQWVSDALAGSG